MWRLSWSAVYITGIRNYYTRKILRKEKENRLNIFHFSLKHTMVWGKKMICKECKNFIMPKHYLRYYKIKRI